jgi:hypothetical protein
MLEMHFGLPDGARALPLPINRELTVVILSATGGSPQRLLRV